jgi:dTMP kinase
MPETLSPTVEEYIEKKLSNPNQDRPGKLIVVEGLDGVGKTTAIRNLAREVGAEWFSSPIADIHKETRQAIDEIAFTDPLTRFRFYQGANRYDSEYIVEPAIEAGKIILLDRYEITTLLAHTALDVDLDPEIEAIESLDWIVPADLTIFLRLSEAERVRRIMKRAESQGLSNLDMDLEHQRRLQAMYDQLATKGLVDVDTEGLAIEEVTEKLLTVLQERNLV